MDLIGFFIGSLLDPTAWVLVLICSLFVWKRKDGLRYLVGFGIPLLLILFLSPSHTKEDLLIITIATILKSYILLLVSNKFNKKNN